MAPHAACGIHPPAGWSPHLSANSLQGRPTRPSRKSFAQTQFRSSHCCLWVQRCHHDQRAGLSGVGGVLSINRSELALRSI